MSLSEIPGTMRAAVWDGGPPRLRVETVRTRSPGPGEVLVAVAASPWRSARRAVAVPDNCSSRARVVQGDSSDPTVTTRETEI